MTIALALLRHGRATGQGPEAALLPEGVAHVATLGRRLAREGWRPGAAFSSPYLRARDTARIVLGEVASNAELETLPDLTPDADPDRLLDTLLARELPAGPVLLVAHMPLLGRLAAHLAGDQVDFHPGTFAELELRPERRRARITRVIGPQDL